MKSAIGILCGGKSRRMGQDKAFLKWKEGTMLDRMVQEMSRDGREILISASAELAPVIMAQSSARVIADEWFDHGPLEGIHCVMKEAQADTVFFCAVDMPFISLEAAEYLEQKLQEPEYEACDCLVLEDEERIHPLCGIYRRRVVSVLERQLKDQNYRVMAFLESMKWQAVRIGESGLNSRVLWNANTPEDYERALRELELQ